MKQVFTIVLFAALTALVLAPNQSFAASDTLTVYATPIAITLDSVVAQDQRSAAPHLVYKLVSTDTPYVFDKSVVVDNSVTFIGVPGAQGRPPCIQPNVLPDNSIPGHLFTFTKSGSVVKISNLYLIGISINNSINQGDGFGITVTADNVKCWINNVVFEQWSQFGINYSGNWDSFWITNCKFRNFVNPGSDYTGEAFRNRNDLGHFPTDTVVMRYNTFLCLNGYVSAPVTTTYMRYFDFSHNTIVATFKNPFFAMNATNWKFEHNILYAAWSGGMANGEYPWWDRIWSPGVGSLIDLDTLSKSVASGIVDTTAANWLALAEAARIIKVNDNVYFKPASITATVAAWNADTANNHNWIYECGWMNDITTTMFSNHAGFQNIGNQNVDPGYGTGITTMIAASGTPPAADGIGLIPWLREFRAAGVATHMWGYMAAAPDFSSGNWKPTWPLPEETSDDLKYTASLTATDGQKYGDTYWFTHTPNDVKSQLTSAPREFTLSEAYPNPFNPSTNIQYTLNKSGVTSLKVYNILGQLVTTLVNNVQQDAGSYRVSVDMSNFNSGVYFSVLEQSSNRAVQKMMLLK